MSNKPYTYTAESWRSLSEVGEIMGIGKSQVHHIYSSGLSKIGLSLFRRLRRTEPTPTELQTLIGDENFLCLIEQIMLEKKSDTTSGILNSKEGDYA